MTQRFETHARAVAGLSTSQPAGSVRPPLIRCTEAEFLDDLWRFLSVKRGKDIDRAAFPDVVLNGSQLDLFALYKETASRGGYKCAPNPENSIALCRTRTDIPPACWCM